MSQIYTNIFNHENIENNEIHENFFLQKPRNTLFEFCSSYGTFVLSVMSLSLRASF